MSDSTEPQLDVFVSPMRRFARDNIDSGNLEPRWSPLSSTLIFGPRSAVLVDAQLTLDQADAVADWVEGHGKHLDAILITHGHSDHWMGLARLLQRFPDARGLATSKVAAHANFEATNDGIRTFWQTRFPGQLPDNPVPPGVLEDNRLDLDGHEVHVIDIGQGDVEHSSIIHVPSIAAVAAGDVVYNKVHMMTALTDAASRQAWIASLDAISALNPEVVVAGHKRVGAADTPDAIEHSRQYLRNFTRVAEEEDTVDAIVAAMLQRHPDRDNPWVLWYCASEAVAKRG